MAGNTWKRVGKPFPTRRYSTACRKTPTRKWKRFSRPACSQTEERFAQAPAFDRQVLRARNQGRKAKELVKRRLDAETSQDIPLLLELARGRSSRDAEWALGQLARLAVAGVEIEGVEVASSQ